MNKCSYILYAVFAKKINIATALKRKYFISFTNVIDNYDTCIYNASVLYFNRQYFIHCQLF